MPRTARLAVGGPAGETTDFDADHKFSQLERMLLTAAVCTEMPAPPSSSALLLGGSAMGLGVQGGTEQCAAALERHSHISETREGSLLKGDRV